MENIVSSPHQPENLILLCQEEYQLLHHHHSWNLQVQEEEVKVLSLRQEVHFLDSENFSKKMMWGIKKKMIGSGKEANTGLQQTIDTPPPLVFQIVSSLWRQKYF